VLGGRDFIVDVPTPVGELKMRALTKSDGGGGCGFSPPGHRIAHGLVLLYGVIGTRTGSTGTIGRDGGRGGDGHSSNHQFYPICFLWQCSNGLAFSSSKTVVEGLPRGGTGHYAAILVCGQWPIRRRDGGRGADDTIQTSAALTRQCPSTERGSRRQCRG
jgi:hypothetical protein